MVTILVPTDFSALADNAIDYAAALVQHYKAKLILFNAFTLPIHVSETLLPPIIIQELIDDNEQRLKEKALSVSNTFHIQVGYECTYAFIEEELNDLLTKYNANLVVLGMASKTIEQDLLGNTTTVAISKMRFPVLAIPLGAKFQGMKKILFACDVLQGVSLKVLARIKELALVLKLEVEVFYVDKTVEQLKNNASEALSLINDGLNGVTYSHKNVKSNAVIGAIEKEIVAYQADLLIMVPKKYGFWASLIHKSKTRIMASGLDIPLLSIPI
jgi:nucleotide-binding universal stress UspA family protein